MVGITAFQAYVPPYRLSRAEISRAWGTKSSGGERAVAKYDEDSVTMAVEATIGCMRRLSQRPEGLFFTTTTSPYKEKQAATLLAAAADLSREIRTADFSDSLRASTTAMIAGVDAVKSGTVESLIVASADGRIGEGKSPFEQLFGEGAAAIALGRKNVLANFEGSYSLSNELIDWWRLNGDVFTRSWEERFVITEGYLKTMQQVISHVMESHHLSPKDFSKVVYYGPDSKSHALLAKRLGFDKTTQVQDPLFDRIGNTGTAALPLMLVAALEESSPGDLFLVANYADGADAFILRVTENIRAFKPNLGIRELLDRIIPIAYQRYLNWKDLVPVHELSRPVSPPPSITCLWRESKGALSLYGSRCLHCGTPQYPPQRICTSCLTKDQFEDYKFSDRVGHVFAYTVDYLTTNRESPSVVGVIDFQGGGRLMCEVTECEPSEIKVGMPVEMCFRKIGLRGGIHSYFWKARPVRTADRG